MSVVMSKRGASKLDIVQYSCDIVAKLDDIIKNEKYVPKRARLLLPKRAYDKAIDMMIEFSGANTLTITADAERYNKRREHQLEGLAALGALEPMLNMLWIKYSIPTGTMGEVFDLLDSIKKKFSNWQYSDAKRFAEAVKKQAEKNLNK
jgi:hypothetical protein